MEPAAEPAGGPRRRDERIERAAERVAREALDEVRAEVREILKERLLEAALDGLDGAGEEEQSPRPRAAREIDATVQSIAAHAARPSFSGLEEPAGPDVLYVYGIAGGDVTVPDVPGIGDRPAAAVSLDRVQALTTWIPPVDLGEAAMDRHLEDPGWLAQNATAHERVLSRALESGPVLPFRFGTVFRDEEQLRTSLRPHVPRFEAALARVGDSAEWDVKVLCRRRALAAWIEERSERVAELRAADPVGEGAGFMQRKRVDRAVAEEADRHREELGRMVADTLRVHAEDAVPADGRAAPEEDALLLRSDAYLVADGRRAPFLRAAADAEARLADRGVKVQVSGPLPPYHFVAVDLREPADA